MTDIALQLRRMEILASRPGSNPHVRTFVTELVGGRRVEAWGSCFGQPRRVTWRLDRMKITSANMYRLLGVKPQPRASAAQINALQNIAAGRPINHGLAGASAHGGLTSTRTTLYRNGWVVDTEDATVLTEAGRLAIGVLE